MVEFHVWKKGASDEGVSSEQLELAFKLATEYVDLHEGWVFNDPVQHKSFGAKRYFNREDAEDQDLVAGEYANLIREIAPSFLESTDDQS